MHPAGKNEQKQRDARNKVEDAGAGKHAIAGEVPALQGVSADVDPNAPNPDADKKKQATARDTIAGAKMGIWGAILGALLLGPAGLILMGAAAFGAGFMMSKIGNDGV